MFDGLRNFNPEQWVITMIVLIIAITIHEFAHAVAADRSGDPTPRSQGRISLNPIDHLDPLGTVMMAISTAVGFGFGWGKPVMTQPANFKHPRWDGLIVAIWGPISNMLQAIVLAGILRFGLLHQWFELGGPQINFLLIGITVNVVLALLNMIPLGPLDGAKVLSALLHPTQAQAYDTMMRTIGGPLFLILAMTGFLGVIIGRPAQKVVEFLIGVG